MKKTLVGVLALGFTFFILFSGCQKGAQPSPSEKPLTLAAVSSPIVSECSSPYRITLESVTQVGSNYEWVWSVMNPNPGNGTNGTVQNLSHWDITLGDCATMDDVVGGAVSTDGITWTSFVPVLQGDASILNTCSVVTGPVLKFDLGTTAGAKSYYKLIINKNYGVDLTGFAYYKSGNTTGCGTTCFPGIGCPEPVTDEGCSFSQGYWFAKPDLVWPGNVTVGGYSYTQAEGVAIWKSSNAGGIGTAKKVFLQAAAIKLSGSSVSPSASVWPYVQTIDNWLATLPKLTAANVKSFNGAPGAAAAVAAADAISTWIEAHHCE
ncbi:hypothetical protein ACWKWU_18030 [Chitinophaga lutea]